jgi:hypothetical protein
MKPSVELASQTIPGGVAMSAAMAFTAPKYGTLIPNRIFVGGLPSNTTEQELKAYFSSYGQVKDAKIINDRSGLSKGVYGFVTFENQEVAEKIIKNESESLVFKDRKLNIGHAIRKQPQIFPRTDLSGTFCAVPYSLQNGLTVLQVPGQDFSFLPQTSPYGLQLMQQPLYFQQPYAIQTPALPALPTTATNNQLPALPLQVDHWPTNGQNNGIQVSTGLTNNFMGGSVSNNFQPATPQQGWRWATASTPQTAQAGTAYVYSPFPNNGPEVMYIQQAPGSFTQNSTSDYSTDTSTQSMFDTTEPSDNSPRRAPQETVNHFSSAEHVLHLTPSLRAPSTLGPTALFGHQVLSTGTTAIKPGMPPYAFTRVLPTAPILNHVNRSGSGKDEQKIGLVSNCNFIETTAMAVHH